MIKLFIKDVMSHKIILTAENATKLYQIIRQHKQIFDTCYFKIYNI